MTMHDLADNRLVKTFAELRSSNKKALMPFLTAGYPDLETTAALLKDFEARGVRIVELGIPFSDPIADGPTIQASYTDALVVGVSSEKIFDMVRSYRKSSASRDRKGAGISTGDWKGAGNGLALVAMVSYSIVFKHGVESYLADAAEAGFDGIIIPDLPLEEAAELEPLAASAGLANVMLIAPTTPLERRLEIARHSRGFIYYISIAGITGERVRLPEQSIRAVAELRTHTDTPVCIGFGISNAETVAHVCEVADGAIVGSAIIHRITDAKDAPRDELVAKVGEFVGGLLSPLK